MDIISGLYSIYLKDRLSEINDYAQLYSDIQNEQLSNLLHEAADTEWGRRYDFRTIYSYQEFKERIPVQTLQDLKPYLDRIRNNEQDILWPGLPKDIISWGCDAAVPLTAQSIEETFQQGISDSYTFHLKNQPDSKLLEGYSANVGTGGSYPCMNELYALLRENEPFLNSLLNLPRRMGNDMDGNPSIELVFKETYNQRVTSFKGSASRLKELQQKAIRKTGVDSFKALWPESEVLFSRSPARTAEIEESSSRLPEGISMQSSYCSPEGLIGIQNDPNDKAMMLMLDLSMFFEFIPANGKPEEILPLEEVETGIDYRLVITNCSGLWRCCSEGPLMRFVSKNPYRFILV